MMKNNPIEQDLNRIRLEIYNETKGMTPEQRVEHTRKVTEGTVKKYNFKVVKSTSRRPWHMPNDRGFLL